nr:MAG TPA: hypothetical protein [Bacteriophage sp.]
MSISFRQTFSTNLLSHGWVFGLFFLFSCYD